MPNNDDDDESMSVTVCYKFLLAVDVGKCWMDALELAVRCSSLLLRTMTRDAREAGDLLSLSVSADEPSDDGSSHDARLLSLRQRLNDSDCERHFNGRSPQHSSVC